MMGNYVTRVLDQPSEMDAATWDALLPAAPADSGAPFMRHAYLAALHASGSACVDTGWAPQWLTVWRDGQLAGAAPLYAKQHSYGEYVFDWAWAQAYEQHGVPYYPKGLVAVPFTPVSGPRLLALDAEARAALVRALLAHAREQHWSSLHILFAQPDDVQACVDAGLMLRHTVQFHWRNAGYADFDTFLATLQQEKRKKIRQERRKVADAGVTFTALRGAQITPQDWDFFYRCYERTYWEHGNAPYLSRDFFARIATELSSHWLMFVAYDANGQAIAASLVALSDASERPAVAYGRYWGALQRVDCLHFEACYYQPLQWCIAHGVERFEGGAQGEHKMARALMPVSTTSAHWLAHPAFADAVERYLEREGQHVSRYLEHLDGRSPFKMGTSNA